MGFTTAAFIRRNTPELRKKLEELGYRKYGNPFQITDDSKYSKLYTIIVATCIKKSTFTIGEVLNEVCGDSWGVMCCIEFMEKLGFLREICALGSMTQDRRFVLLN